MTMPERTPLLTGGCQCGAVRYALYAPPRGVHICHCRMCQKAAGNLFIGLAPVARADFAWTRGTPGIFNSSPLVERGFCAACGTPLSFAYTDQADIDVTIGSLDDPAAVCPEMQYGTEARLPYFAALHELPGSRTEDDIPPERLAQLKSLQHPDG